MKRRRHQRFQLREEWRGDLCTCHHATIERLDDRTVRMYTEAAASSGEVVKLHWPGAQRHVKARVVSVRASLDGQHLARRLIVESLSGGGFGRRMPPAILIFRELPVVVLDVGRTGCQLRGPRMLATNAIGRLRVLGPEGLAFDDAVRVAWCQPRQGAGATHIYGVELLPTSREIGASAPSIRNVLQTMAAPSEV